MWLMCSQRCGGKLFRALAAEVDVDAEGVYQSHRLAQPGFLCLACGSPAVDLGEVPSAMAAEDEEDASSSDEGLEGVVAVDVLCPLCETRVTVFPGEECPNCGSVLEVV